MLGYIKNQSHSFGEESCQDEFILSLNYSTKIADEVRQDRVISKGELHYAEGNLLSTVASIYREVQAQVDPKMPSYYRQLE